jgi:glycosyltransferase involved in cell wall biosynthesis
MSELGDQFEDFGWNTFAFERVAQDLVRQNVNVIHAGFAGKPATAAMILSDLARIPFSFEAHAYDLFVNFSRGAEKVEKAKWIFTISEYNRSYLAAKYDCDPGKVKIFRVPINREHCERTLGTPRKDNLIVSVCRLHPTKGLEFAIDAFKHIAEKRHDLEMVIIGDGDLKEALQKRVNGHALDGKVRFLGSMGNEAALDYIATATLFVLPSVIAPNGDRDGIPTALIEAMYMGTPVVSTRVSGIPELIDDGVNGYLAEPGDVTGLADKMERLLNDAALRQTIGQQARRKVVDNFYEEESADVMIKGWREIGAP